MYFLLLGQEGTYSIVSMTAERPVQPTKAGGYVLLDTEAEGEHFTVTPEQESYALLRRAADSYRAANGAPPTTDDEAKQLRKRVVKLLDVPDPPAAAAAPPPAAAVPDEPALQPTGVLPPASQPDAVPVDPPSDPEPALLEPIPYEPAPEGEDAPAE